MTGRHVCEAGPSLPDNFPVVGNKMKPSVQQRMCQNGLQEIELMLAEGICWVVEARIADHSVSRFFVHNTWRPIDVKDVEPEEQLGL